MMATFPQELKGLENTKEQIKLKIEDGPSLLNFQMNIATNDLRSKLEETESALATINSLRNKTDEILSKANNPELEMDFRATCSVYQTSYSLLDPLLMQAYQDYLNAYQQKTSLYNIVYEIEGVNLHIYNTETESEEVKILQTPEPLDFGTCITQLPNGKLLCFTNGYHYSGITLLIDVNREIEVLPSGTFCCYSSCIYFNNSVYFFGGFDGFHCLTQTSRFDLDRNRWIQLASMPKADKNCNSIIFNGNILISGLFNRNLWLYSIDIDSFSTIPYEFEANKIKALINAERLYLIECNGGSIYESEIGSDTNWRRIADSIIYSSIQVYCSYNKGEICIGVSNPGNVDYYKFDLNKKLIRKF